MLQRLGEILLSVPDLLLVVIGFSLIIIIHEAGHFFAARWAGIRVLAFAVGFGPALVSFRKGLGWRRGSSEPDYSALQNDAKGEPGEKRERARSLLAQGISPTEYRLNVLPFGGYVKMLGQDDADPTARSDEPDSFQNCPPWKRMVVISAGVIFNVITAAILFVIVFNPYVGLKTEPAKVGKVADPDSPAAVAVATNARELGITEPGLHPGDTIIAINGDRPSHFPDITTGVAMSRSETPLLVDVIRPDVKGVLHFAIRPERDPDSKFLAIGINRYASDRLVDSNSKRVRTVYEQMLAESGFPTLKPGMQLVEIDGVSAQSPYTLDRAVDRSDGQPVRATFASAGRDGAAAGRTTVEIKPQPKLMTARVVIDPATGEKYRFEHLLGLTPVFSVGAVAKGEPAEQAGIRRGDIFARLGDVEWPSVPAGMREIRSHADKPLRASVLRKNAAGVYERIEIASLHPTSKGRIGIGPGDSSRLSNHVGGWPLNLAGDLPTPSGGALPGLAPGSRILEVNGHPVSTLADLRNELKEVQGADNGATVTLRIELSAASPGVKPATEEITWKLSRDEVASLTRLGWTNPLDSTAFEPETFVWKADSLGGAIPMGLHETRRVMMNAYVTFARLFQGTVQPEHLKGPIGIAHLGVAVADRGLVWLLFFMGLISVNLAVINFMPIPIADGGHMVFLIYEQITGKPPSARFQNAAAIVGLVLIGTVLLVVTFYDVRGVFDDLRRFFRS